MNDDDLRLIVLALEKLLDYTTAAHVKARQAGDPGCDWTAVEYQGREARRAVEKLRDRKWNTP